MRTPTNFPMNAPTITNRTTAVFPWDQLCELLRAASGAPEGACVEVERSNGKEYEVEVSWETRPADLAGRQ